MGAHHAHLVVFFTQVVEHDVAERNQATQLFPLHRPGGGVETMTAHELPAMLHLRMWFNGAGVFGHYIADTGRGRIKSLNDDDVS